MLIFDPDGGVKGSPINCMILTHFWHRLCDGTTQVKNLCRLVCELNLSKAKQGAVLFVLAEPAVYTTLLISVLYGNFSS